MIADKRRSGWSSRTWCSTSTTPAPSPTPRGSSPARRRSPGGTASTRRRRPLQDGAEHRDGEVLHRLLRRGRASRTTRSTAWTTSPGTAARSSPTRGPTSPRAIDGLDLQEVLRYAKSKGVKIRLWMHWQAAETHMDRAFPLYREWGVEGVMLDFMDRDDQEMVRFLRRALETAADEPPDRHAARRVGSRPAWSGPIPTC